MEELELEDVPPQNYKVAFPPSMDETFSSLCPGKDSEVPK